MKTISTAKSHGGVQGVYTHASEACACDMTFAVFVPPQAEAGPCPVVWYLSGLTCTHANVMEKGEYRRWAAELGLIVVCPDTSPRGDDVADEKDNWQFGSGAGFYVDATQTPYDRHYRMFSYVTEELPALIAKPGAWTNSPVRPLVPGTVRDVLDALKNHAPPPLSQRAASREVVATEPAMTGIVFKIQANMDPNHRDRIAFMRVCSGKLTRGMKVKHVRSGKQMALSAPQFFFAQDRSLAEEAFAGDVVGIPNRGVLRIGDALTEGEDITFLGIPSFAPEILRRIRLEDAIKAKKLKDAVREMAEEGVVQVFNPLDGTQPIVGVIGALQLDVLADRLKHEYGLATDFDPAPCEAVRWIRSDDPAALKAFIAANRSSVATDLDGDHVYIPSSIFTLNYNAGRNPEIQFLEIKT